MPKGIYNHKSHSEETKMKMSKSHRGKPSGMIGKYHSIKTKNKMSIVHLGKRNSIKHNKNISKSRQGIKFSKKTKRRMSDAAVQRFKEGVYNLKPNKPEKILIEIIKENNLPFNYVGDGMIWFKGFGHSFNPDFLSKNPKHIIELFGDYWHNLPNVKEKDKKRLQTYSKYGYKTLVIWENELKNKQEIINKINSFIICERKF